MILSNIVNDVQYDQNPRDYYNLEAKALEQQNHRKIYDRLREDRQVIVLDFGDAPDKLKGEYLDMYDRVRSEVLCTTKFDENSNLSTTNLGRIDMTRFDQIKAEERFPISERGYTVGKLLGGMLFIIPIIIDMHGHRFEIFTLVSEIHENIGLVLGIKNIFELEGIINLGE